jgi:hypothetical protein
MTRRAIVSGLVGGVVLIVWTFVVNGIFRFGSSINMNRVPDERRVYEMLKETVVEPGHYVINPEVVPAEGFPAGEPVFSLSYSGFGHEAAGGLFLLHLAIAFLATIIAASMLSAASPRILASYVRKVLFFTGIGLLFALFHDLHAHGIGGYPLRDALLLAANSVVSWTVVGAAVAGLLKPAPEEDR